MSSFTQKNLRVTIILATPGATFAGQSGNTWSASTLRVVATVQGGARLGVVADIKIFGMLPQDMNALTVMWFNPPVIMNNVIVLEASDDAGVSWSQVFSGSILEAQPDYRGAPEVYFHIQAKVGYSSQILPVAPKSYTGSTSVATIVQQLAQQMGFAFENNGVTAQLNEPYLPGTAYDQLQKVCQHSDTDFYFVANAQAGSPGTLAIVPAGLARTNVQATVLNAGSGLEGYPVIERNGILLQALYNPSFVGGGRIQLEGSPTPAVNGLWTPYFLAQQLESVSPRGSWMTTLRCSKYGVAAPDPVLQ
jgi:hypothetical protein